MGFSIKFYKVILMNNFLYNNFFFSLAKDFFLKLCDREPFKRYTAEQALNHPWITRNVKNEIPLTFEEQHKIFLRELEIISVKITQQNYLIKICR